MGGVRKLAAVCAGYCGAVFLSHYLFGTEKLFTAAIVCLAIAVSGLLFRKNIRKRIVLLFLAAAVGFAAYKYNFDTFVAPCEALADSKMTVSAVVTELPDERKSCLMLYVRFCDDKLPRTDGVLFDYEKANTTLRPGDVIRVDIKLRSALTRYNEETDLNISKGLYALGYINGDCVVTGHEGSVKYLPKLLGEQLREKIKEIFPADSAPFMLALLTGDKNSYYDDDKLSTSMSTAGLSHVVAVSGMHVAFLVGFLQMIMGINRRSSAVCIALVWAFVIMVGTPPSAVRAAVMQTMLIGAYLFRRESDNATTLSFAMALILIANPFACGSVSLQLSFGAMAGIMIFTRPIYTWLSEHIFTAKVRICDYASGALASSIAALVFTVPLIAWHFGYISVLSMLANMLCLWCISLLFCGGYVICALGIVIPPLARVLAAGISFLVRYIALVVKWIAEIPFSAVYAENKLVIVWLFLAYAVFAAYLLIKRKKKISALIPVGVAAISFAALLLSMHVSMLNDEGTLTVLDVGSGQSIAMTSGENSVVIDCGSGGIAENPGFLMSSYLHAGGRNSVDYLVLTHLHTDHAKGVRRLLNSIDVKTLVLPYDAVNGNGLLEEILSAAKENGTEVFFADESCEFSCGDIDFNVYKLASNKEALMIKARTNGHTLLVTGDAEAKAERELADTEDLSDTEIFIVGHHGSKYSNCEELLSEVRPDIAVVSVGENSYGHPTQEVVDRLRDVGAELFRTDTDGRFVMRLN